MLEGFVLNAASGEPLAGAEIRSWFRNNQGQRQPGRRPRPTRTACSVWTAASGATCCWPRYGRPAAGHGQRVLGQPARPAGRGRYQRTIFFTDRSLYRPGQTIQYKGICIDVDQEQDNYQMLRRPRR